VSAPDKLSALLARIVDAHGFLSLADLAELAKLDRLRPVLVRFQEGRCLVPAQDAAALIEAVERGGWWCRDVSLPAEDPAMMAPMRGCRRCGGAWGQGGCRECAPVVSEAVALRGARESLERVGRILGGGR